MNQLIRLNEYCKNELVSLDRGCWWDLCTMGIVVVLFLGFLLTMALGFCITWPVSFMQQHKAGSPKMYWVGLIGIYFVAVIFATYLIW